MVLVRWADEQGLHVAAQGTGHAAAAHASLSSALLVKTVELHIDAERHRAWVGAGVVWRSVSAAAAEHGLAALAGSGPDVGVVGYTLGGGISWLARRYGLAANGVLAVELVTPTEACSASTAVTSRSCSGRCVAVEAPSVW